jgi:hypothetical protein
MWSLAGVVRIKDRCGESLENSICKPRVRIPSYYRGNEERREVYHLTKKLCIYFRIRAIALFQRLDTIQYNQYKESSTERITPGQWWAIQNPIQPLGLSLSASKVDT